MSDPTTAGRIKTVWLLGAVALICALSVIGWLRLRVDTSLEPLLPEKSDARQTIIFLRDSSFASKAVLWFQLKDANGSAQQLYAAADAAEKQLDPTLVKKVVHPPAQADAMDEMIAMLDHAGELLNPKDLAEVKAATTPAALAKRMKECFMQLTRPEGSFMQPVIRKDPLGISSRILTRLYALTQGIGFQVQIKDGRLLSTDGRNLMLVLETRGSATNLAGSRALVANLDKIAADAPPGVKIVPICAQIHTAENQSLMEHDINRLGIINGIVFLALFLLVSRDWRVGAIFMLPIASIAVTIGLCALVDPKLSMMVIGVAITMAGSAVDYGIYVYTAVTTGKDPNADLRRIFKPLIISHLTTLGVFLAFVFSSFPAYRQLGWLTSASLVLSLLSALFVLPRIVKPGGKIWLLGSGMPLAKWGRLVSPTVAIGGILFIAMAFEATRTSFDSNITDLDGVSATVKTNEADFQKTWGGSDVNMGILVATGNSREAAEEANDRLYETLETKMKPGQFASLASFWPSKATREANLQRWKSFWTKDRIDKLRQNLAAAAKPYGFSDDAFAPFFQSISNPTPAGAPGQILSGLEDQFFARSGDQYQVLSYFPDTEENVAIVRAAVAGSSNALVVSRRALGHAFATAALSEIKLLVSLSAAFIIIFLLVLTRSIGKSLLIMSPAIAGMVTMLAVLAILSMSMNVVTVVAAILVLALASDYGVFAAFAWDNHEPLVGQGMASIHLCAMTTAVGTAALIFAKHPALLMVGVSLTSGLVGGYLTALFIIPGILWLVNRRAKRSMP